MKRNSITSSKKIQNLIKDIDSIRFLDLELLKKKCDLLESFAEKTNDLYAIAFSNIFLAHYYQINQKEDDYKFHSNKAKKIASQNQFSTVLIEYYKLSYIYNAELGDSFSSISACLRGLEIALEAKDYQACTAFNNNIAENFYQSEVSDIAETYFLRALDNTAQTKEVKPKYKDLVLMNLVDVFVLNKDIEKAKYWLNLCHEYGYDTSFIAAYSKRSEICILVLDDKVEEAFEKIKELRKDLEKEEPMLFINVYLYLMDIILIIKEKNYADWCLNVLMSLFNDVNEKFKIKILTYRIRYSEVFHVEDEDAFTKFYEVTLTDKKLNKKINYENQHDLIQCYFANINQEKMGKKEENSNTIIEKDELSDVYSRRYFSKLLTKSMYDENVNTLGIIMIDIDYFKEYNNTYGYVQGDVILKNVATTLVQNVPQNIYPTRFGGDEFACICINKSDEEIIAFIENVQNKIKHLRIEHKAHRNNNVVTLSFGFYNSYDHTSLLERTEDALFKAKTLGRNTYYPRRFREYHTFDSKDSMMNMQSQNNFIKEYHRALEMHQNYALIQINIKNFRYYNTKYGFKEGDNILQLLYEAIINFLRDGEHVVRMYADNFAILLTYQNIHKLIDERLSKSIELFFSIEDPRIHRNLFLTYGVYEMKDKTIAFQEAWSTANLTRKEVASPTKRNSSIGLYEPKHRDSFLERIQLEVDTAAAYKNNEFIPFYQPKVDAKTHEIVGAEVLLRWYDKAGNLIPLYKFLPILNENSYIKFIDLYIFETTCQMLDERIKNKRPVVPISFNISKSYFYDDNISKDYIHVFEKFDIPKNLVEFELMETISLDDTQRLKEVIKGFNDYGFKCVLDDFGNGYSSFNVLLNNKLSAVKIDRQFFLKNLNGDNELIIQTVINLIKSLHMKVVAEGVETKEYADFLAECGCDMIQGYYFYEPMPLKKFYTILNQAR